MRRTSRLLAGDEETFATADTRNPAGAPAWKYTPKELLVTTLLTNTLKPTYYADPRTLATEALDNHKAVLDEDPEFYMKALVYSRTEGYARLQTVLGMVLLTTKDIPIPATVFNKVMRTPNDIASFIDLCKNAKIRKGMGQKVKALLTQWLANKISQYWAIKYAQPLTQAIKMSHPKMNPAWDRPVALAYKAVQRQVVKITSTGQEELDVETDAVAEPIGTAKDVADYLMAKSRKELISDSIKDKLPQIKVYEELKQRVGQEEPITVDEVRRAIHEGKLPHEALTGIISPTVEMWKELMHKMPYFALLRHLATLNRSGVFDDVEALDIACQKLSNPELVDRSQIYPYRFFIAYNKLKGNAPQPILEALEYALNASFRNIPELGGRGCIAIDTSGSMTSSPKNERGRTQELRYIDIAATFGIPLMMKSPDAIVLPFDMAGGRGFGDRYTPRSGLYPELLDRTRPMLWNIEQLSNCTGGGTDVSLPIRYLEHNEHLVDWFIGITDSIEWGTTGYGTEAWLTAWRRYKSTIAPEAKAFLVTISPYGDSMSPFEEPDVYHIFGWSDQVLRFIHLGISGIETQLQHIENLPLELEVIEIE